MFYVVCEKGNPDYLVVFFAGFYRGQDVRYDFLYFTTMGKKGPESISASQVVMDPGPVCIICELYLDNTEKVLLGLSNTKPNLLSITPARDCNRARSINASLCYKSLLWFQLFAMSFPHPMIDGRWRNREDPGGDT